MTEYDDFIAGKTRKPIAHGFDPVLPLNHALFDWQKVVVQWAIKQGRCALFEDCGLGKTLQQLEWARHVQSFTNGMVLILCPLQLDVINRLLRLWSRKGDTVFSPFMGIGSEGFCAVNQGRKFIGAELKESYWKQACKFLRRAESESYSLFDGISNQQKDDQ